MKLLRTVKLEVRISVKLPSLNSSFPISLRNDTLGVLIAACMDIRARVEDTVSQAVKKYGYQSLILSRSRTELLKPWMKNSYLLESVLSREVLKIPYAGSLSKQKALEELGDCYRF